MRSSTRATHPDTDYYLGTHDEEVARLGLQHQVWRARVFDAWRRANFTVGQTILDVGCGPGWASLDLAEIVGRHGRVVSLDRSEKFLETLRVSARARGIANISVHETDLDTPEFPHVSADAAWCRWVLGFLKQPRNLLEKLATVMRPGARLVLYEYFAYGTWALSPSDIAFDEFVRLVTKTWRDTGGEPNIGVDVVRWLPDCGFRILDMRPIIDVVSPDNFVWQWPASFIETGTKRLVDLGVVSESHAAEVMRVLDERESDPGSLMITPGVLEIIAERSG